MGYFKDISEMLAKKYPDRKVFVISDEHFDHKNIIGITRSELFGDDEDSVNKMNEYIISKHNSVVGPDDIVIMLGDFSFKTGIERLSELTSKLNGHKFLIVGNHDKVEKPDVYLRAGFEDIFLSPIKFNGDFYSHYPLNATKDSQDRPDTVLYNYLCKEFSDSSSGINFHGHQHELINNGDREKNVACEVIGYTPLLVGRTKSYQVEDNPQFINEEFFDVFNRVMSRFGHLQENSLMTDYVYTILLDLLSEYEDQIIAFGSIMLNKKYGTNFIPSDLDVTKLFDSSKSVRANREAFKKIGSEIYQKLVQVNGCNSDFYKKIDFICILSFIYATKKGSFKGYLDMNVLLDEFYKSSDFIKVNGGSILEQYANKAGIEVSSMKYPRFNIQTTNAMADIINCFLQYIYSNDSDKKKTSLVKMKKIMKSVDISSNLDFEELQNMLIRYLLRNIFFFENTRRKDDSNLILRTREIEVPELVGMDRRVEDALSIIIHSDDYHKILESIDNSSNRKNEISSILKYYK